MASARAAVAGIALGLALLSPIQQAVAVPPLTQPAWRELPVGQQQILAPLAGEWDRLEPWRRKKWLGIAERYPSMSADEQARIQRRMKDWVKLTPEERKAAREKYKTLQKAPPEHREAVKQQWQEYKALPEEEKQRLKAQAGPRKPVRSKSVGVKPLSSPPVPAPLSAPAISAPAAALPEQPVTGGEPAPLPSPQNPAAPPSPASTPE